MFLHIRAHSEADPWEGRHFFYIEKGDNCVCTEISHIASIMWTWVFPSGWFLGK